jgi:hypothetical protein
MPFLLRNNGIHPSMWNFNVVFITKYPILLQSQLQPLASRIMWNTIDPKIFNNFVPIMNLLISFVFFFFMLQNCSLDWILEVTAQLSHNTNVNSLKGGVYNWKFGAYIFISNPTRGMGIKEWNYGKHFKRKFEHHLSNLHQSKFFLLLWVNLKC